MTIRGSCCWGCNFPIYYRSVSIIIPCERRDWRLVQRPPSIL